VSTKDIIASLPSLEPHRHRPIAPAGTTLVAPTFCRRFLAGSFNPTFGGRLVSDSGVWFACACAKPVPVSAYFLVRNRISTGRQNRQRPAISAPASPIWFVNGLNE
jgi:hypothetical protein